jgi:hypothetical protein
MTTPLAAMIGAASARSWEEFIFGPPMNADERGRQGSFLIRVYPRSSVAIHFFRTF